MKLVSWVFAIKHLCEMPGNFKEIKFLGEQSMPYSSDTLLWLQKPLFFSWRDYGVVFSFQGFYPEINFFAVAFEERERETSK